MTYLPNLIKRINSFCNSAESLIKNAQVKRTEYVPQKATKYEGYDPYAEDEGPEELGQEDSEQEDPLYLEIISSLEDFDNKDIADEVLVVAGEYKAALQINGGFDEVLKH